jgi:hypothetical protein
MAKLGGKVENLLCYRCYADHQQEQRDMSENKIWLEILESFKSLGKVSRITVEIEAMDLGTDVL